MSNSRLVRPTTGKLLVGGDFYLHVGYGIDKSWLAKEDPSGFLFRPNDFDLSDPNYFGSRFAVPAMAAPFPSFLIDVPMARENGALKQSQGISVLYLPEGAPWLSAEIICTLNWKDDLTTRDETGKAWTLWDNTWFRDRVRSVLEDKLSRARQKLQGAQAVIDDLDVVSRSL